MSEAFRRVCGIIQVRMGSSRLPGKSLADIAGRPLLLHVTDRALAAKTVDQVVIATTTDSSDDQIADLAAANEIPLYRGSTDDVLDRYYQAAIRYDANIIVRLTADDPFKDPDVTDLITETLLTGNLDYASNTIEPTFPEGIDVEAFTIEALTAAWRDATLKSDREHVTPFIWRQPERFRLKNVRYRRDLSKLRWTVDYPQDLDMARRVYARLYHGQVFGMEEILALFGQDPSLAAINSGIQRNAGYAKSLSEDSNPDSCSA
jgi:spore coat polysaccharide biosynthesis protein SpsF